MLQISGEALEKILDELDDPTGHVGVNELFELAKNWEEEIALHYYDIAISVCKKSKTADRRERDQKRIVEFVSTCFVACCQIDATFVKFMLRHVRDENLDLREQLRILHILLANHDYSNTLRY